MAEAVFDCSFELCEFFVEVVVVFDDLLKLDVFVRALVLYLAAPELIEFRKMKELEMIGAYLGESAHYHVLQLLEKDLLLRAEEDESILF